jgi:hypothetical protein
MVVIRIDPQPLSKTASGGKRMHNKTRQQLILNLRSSSYLRDLEVFRDAAHLTNTPKNWTIYIDIRCEAKIVSKQGNLTINSWI